MTNTTIDLESAGNPATPSEELAKIAIRQPRLSIKLRLAENINTPHVVLFTLAFDSDVEVRAAVARNPSTPKSLHHFLRNDSSELVRNSL